MIIMIYAYFEHNLRYFLLRFTIFTKYTFVIVFRFSVVTPLVKSPNKKILDFMVAARTWSCCLGVNQDLHYI